MLASLALLVVGVLAAVLAAAAEIVVYAVPEPRIRALQSDGRPGARTLLTLRTEPVKLLLTLWMTRIAATAVAVIAAWAVAESLLGVSLSAAIVAAAAAVVVLSVGELVGRTLVLRRAERLALLAARPVYLLAYILTPLLWPAELLVRALAPAAAEALPRITDRELRDLVSPGNGEPSIEEHERRLIQRALLLDQTRAYDVMTPRVEMFAWSDGWTLAEVAPELRAARYSRVPLYGENIDDITGILYVRDAYQALVSGQRDVKLQALAREPFFVPGSVTLDILLLDFQSRRIQMGIVIDEYGGVDGLITLEDILEELVGEIEDETDIAEDQIVRLGRNEILVHGGADLREINHFFNTTFPLLEHRSLNGYLLDELGRVPEPGERIVRESVLIEVLDATDTQVVRARLTRQAPRPEGEAPPRPTLREESARPSTISQTGAGQKSKAREATQHGDTAQAGEASEAQDGTESDDSVTLSGR